jgi:zinc protease
MRTILLPSKGAPLVSIRLAFATGSAHDPAGREGLAALTGGLLVEGGAGGLSYREILDALYPMAAGIGVQVDREMSVIHGTVHRDHLDAYYELVRRVVLEPRFDASDFERLREDQVNAITAGLRASDDEGLSKETLNALIHEGGPYGRPVEGTVRGVRAIERDDVVRFRSVRFTRGGATAGIAGDVPDRFVRRVVSDLESLPEGRQETAPLPPLRRPSGIELTVVTKPCRAWAISLGYPIAVTRADDDFYPLFLANSYLGEHRTFNGVLMNKMRSQRGLNYGDYSYVENFVQDGASTFPLPNVPRRAQTFSIWIRPVAPSHAHFAIRSAMRELSRLVEDGLTPEAFEETRAFLLNYSKLWAQTPARRLGYALDGAFYGRTSLLEELADRLPRLTAGDVNAAIRRHLVADSAFVAVVADPEGAAGFRERFVADDPSPIVYDTETLPSVLEEDRDIAAYPLRASAGRARVVPAAALFEGDGLGVRS